MEKYSGISKEAIEYPDQLTHPSEKEMDHEKMRIQSMGEKVVRRLKTIKKPQKMFNFALALEDENFHTEAKQAFDKLKEMGYDHRGRKVA